MRLNLFSPLPPLRSEIANHTLTVAAALAPHAELRLWTDQEEVVAGLDLEVVRFDPARPDWARLNEADANIYNIGNNATFHRAIFDVARAAPGIVVLHDTRLQHFFARYSEGDAADRSFYLESLQRSHGLPAVADARRWLEGAETLDTLVARYPMALAALDPALAAVVHNEAEQQALAQQTRVPVHHLPLAYAAGADPERAPPGRTLRLMVFGFLGPNRRLPAILEAIASLSDPDVRLDIYGGLDEPGPVDEQIARLGLVGRVQRHGFVAELDLQAALARADLAINLRYPSMGEASASQLRIWDAALPSVVTRTGWYATLPADTVMFVDPQTEVADLRAHLLALRAEPERFRAAGRRGRAELERTHAPARYAEGLMQIIAGMAGLHGRRAAIDLSRRAAQVLLEMTDEDGIALCAERVAKAVSDLAAGRA